MSKGLIFINDFMKSLGVAVAHWNLLLLELDLHHVQLVIDCLDALADDVFVHSAF